MVFNPKFSRNTRTALNMETEDYVDKDTDEYHLIYRLKKENGLARIYRFDIGKNNDGFSDLISGVLEQADLPELCRLNLVDYPDNHYHLLRHRLAALHGVDPECFVLTAGLESMIDHISRTFIEHDDGFLTAIPNFSVFAAFSIRAGGRPIYLPLDPEKNFQWTSETTAGLKELIDEHSPKILWISNPVNPTGQGLPLEWIEDLAAACLARGTAMVVDEAYGEYTDDDKLVISASRFIDKYPNLMALRTFSKVHALPSLRVGYLMCSNQDIIKAVSVYRPMFPFSWFSLYLARIASIDEEQLINARLRLSARRERLYGQLDRLETFSYIPSSANTTMFRNTMLTADELWEKLACRGFLTANLNRVNGIQGYNFLRMTICNEDENDLFSAACADIEAGLRG